MMKAFTKGTLLFFIAIAPATVWAGGSCLDCHEEKSPGAVRQWQESAHREAGVGCADCHGPDHERIEGGDAVVDAKVCGRCHEEAYRQHVESRHGMGLHSGWGCTRAMSGGDSGECRFCHEEGSTLPLSTVHCARFLKQSPEMREVGCNRCHQVERSCASCHTNHATDLEIVRNPAICSKCHMGPDHPQWEMWQTSMHGILYSTGGESLGPSCQKCHMPAGTHDVSGGLTATPGLALYPEEELAGRREEMLTRCAECHTEGFARRELELGDAIRVQSLALVREAEEIILDLADRGLLDPMPQDRPPHPQRGQQLVTDSQMLYEDISHIERLFFKMKKYDLAKAVKGAYHQNPDYTHWYGNAELKMDLVDIRAEASRLKRLAQAEEKASMRKEKGKGGSDPLEERLSLLKKKFDRGAITEEEYRRQKTRLLEEAFAR